ncbi:hypothetical protein ACFQJC_11465 [Haloferax namakaokahaiae]|uniref:Uncharacterized protein n=1 Tax=Haloferax namakaokahaiae TaxID=1748331 RepID=A0ABD5ZG47_9EURY
MSSSQRFVPFRVSRRVRLAVALFVLLLVVYSVVIAQQILLGVMVVFWVVVLWYGARLVVAIEGIAAQLSRLADSRAEDEATSPVESSRD